MNASDIKYLANYSLDVTAATNEINRPSSTFRVLLVATFTWLIPSLTSAQETDPLCGPGTAKFKWGKENSFKIAGSEAHIASVIASFQANSNSLVNTQSLLDSAQFTLMRNKNIERTVDIEPINQAKAGKYTVIIPSKPISENKCSKAIKTLQGKKEVSADKDYACSLLNLAQECLTNSEEQPHVKDTSIPFRSVATVIFEQRAVCTGLLLDNNSFKTARHCFIDQVTGKPLPEFSSASSNKWSIETLDGKRNIFINTGEIEKLAIPNGFDIDQDSVTVGVTVKASPDAKQLPQIKYMPDLSKDQLLWLVGPVFLLDEAIAMRKAALNPTAAPLKPNWRDSIRWSNLLGAQCRTVKIEGSCIYHSCQSFHGYSGSPLITGVTTGSEGSPDTLEYAGIHAGTPGAVKPNGWPGCMKSTPSFNASNYVIFNVGKSGE